MGKVVAQINKLEPDFENLSDEALTETTVKLRERLKAGTELDSLLPEAFAAVREAGKRVKQEGLDNDLLERIAADSAFTLDEKEIQALLDPVTFTGRAAQLTEEFINQEVLPFLDRNQGWRDLQEEELKV